jgi:hypothetical protein
MSLKRKSRNSRRKSKRASHGVVYRECLQVSPPLEIAHVSFYLQPLSAVYSVPLKKNCASDCDHYFLPPPPFQIHNRDLLKPFLSPTSSYRSHSVTIAVFRKVLPLRITPQFEPRFTMAGLRYGFPIAHCPYFARQLT